MNIHSLTLSFFSLPGRKAMSVLCCFGFLLGLGLILFTDMWSRVSSLLFGTLKLYTKHTTAKKDVSRDKRKKTSLSVGFIFTDMNPSTRSALTLFTVIHSLTHLNVLSQLTWSSQTRTEWVDIFPLNHPDTFCIWHCNITPLISKQQTVKEENPNATFGEMGKLLGARWKEMDDNAKAVSVALVISALSPLDAYSLILGPFLPSFSFHSHTTRRQKLRSNDTREKRLLTWVWIYIAWYLIHLLPAVASDESIPLTTWLSFICLLPINLSYVPTERRGVKKTWFHPHHHTIASIINCPPISVLLSHNTSSPHLQCSQSRVVLARF